MRAALRRIALVTAAFWAAVTLYIAFTVPSAALILDGVVPDTVVFGAYHVHSIRSDGTGDVPAIAAAAADAGLAFVVVTDHGDATRPPDPPAYVNNVLVIDAVEINTSGGHVVALGLDAPSPYPLAGRAADVISDIHRQGGVAIAAHPDSPAPALRWGGGGRGAGRGGRAGGAYDGIEWLNVDSEWRDDGVLKLGGAAARSLFRGPEAIASLFVRPESSLRRWDQALQRRMVVGLAAVDAHGGITRESQDGSGPQTVLPIPTYAALFGTAVQGIVLDSPLTGEAGQDAGRLLDALIAGATFSLLPALARPAHLEFLATSTSGTTVRMGERLPFIAGDAVEVLATVPQAPGVRISLIHEGRVVSTGQGRVRHAATRPGAYRVEVSFPGTSVPWIVSNPIYVGDPLPTVPVVIPGPVDEHPLAADERWVVEREPRSSGVVTIDDTTLVFDYSLAAGVPSGQYAALVAPVGGQTGYDRVVFTAEADRSMRVSFQLRLRGGQEALRWRRSVHVGEEPQEIVVRLDELEPVGGETSQRPLVARIQAVLFVVDTVNTLPDTSGTLRIRDVRLGVGDAGGGAPGGG